MPPGFSFVSRQLPQWRICKSAAPLGSVSLARSRHPSSRCASARWSRRPWGLRAPRPCGLRVPGGTYRVFPACLYGRGLALAVAEQLHILASSSIDHNVDFVINGI